MKVWKKILNVNNLSQSCEVTVRITTKMIGDYERGDATLGRIEAERFVTEALDAMASENERECEPSVEDEP